MADPKDDLEIRLSKGLIYRIHVLAAIARMKPIDYLELLVPQLPEGIIPPQDVMDYLDDRPIDPDELEIH